MFDRAYIERELQRLAAEVRDDITLHVIGGGALAFHGTKPATKDIDAVLLSDGEADSLVAALSNLGYAPPRVRMIEYEEMRARAILENADGFRWDVFVREILGLEFTQSMRSRCREWLRSGRVRVLAACAEDVFFMKSVTSRESDRDDMYAVFAGGMNTDVVRDEVFAQSQVPRRVRVAAMFYAGLKEMVDRFGADYPDLEKLEALAIREQIAGMVLGHLEESGAQTIAELTRKVGESASGIVSAANRLLRQGLIVRRGKRLALALREAGSGRGRKTSVGGRR
jgi:hypothetical protein